MFERFDAVQLLNDIIVDNDSGILPQGSLLPQGTVGILLEVHGDTALFQADGEAASGLAAVTVAFDDISRLLEEE